MLPAEILAWNRTEAEYPRHKTIGQLFEEQVDRTPDAIALIVGERSFSYRELDGRANQLARQLRSCGVEPETLVGVAIERSHEMVVALLATLKAGGAYVPIDPGYPRQRIAHVLDDAQTSVLLTTSRNRPQMPEVSTCIVADGGEAGPIAAQSTERMASSVASHNLAYVLYTSGSAGKPKGVMVEHRNVVNLFTGMDRAIGSDPGVSARPRRAWHLTYPWLSCSGPSRAASPSYSTAMKGPIRLQPNSKDTRSRICNRCHLWRGCS